MISENKMLTELYLALFLFVFETLLPYIFSFLLDAYD